MITKDQQLTIMERWGDHYEVKADGHGVLVDDDRAIIKGTGSLVGG